MRKINSIAFSILIVLFFTHCVEEQQKNIIEENKVVEITGIELDDILKKGKLVAITNNTPTSYFIYKGRPMGYQYQLLRDFTKHLGVDLEIKIIPSIPDALDSLKLLKADILASGLTVLGDRKQHVDFSDPITQTHQVLIQRIPDSLLSKRKSIQDKGLLRDVTLLAGKDIYVEEGSAYIDRLFSLQNEIGDSINIITYSGDIDIDSIMAMVSSGQIQYAISDQYTSNFFLRYYDNLDIKTSVSLNQNIAWAVPKNSNALVDTINTWIHQNKNTIKWVYVFNTYFKHNQSMNQKVSSGYNLENGKISPFDDIIKVYAHKINWDWRLIAAQISVESGFIPNKESWAGASGLMQIMPQTAQRLSPNHTDIFSPSQNIAMGAKLDGILYDYWIKNIPDSIQAIKFALASYNIGKGHVFDAQRLAEKYELNPKIWDYNVELMIKKLSSRHYYQDKVVRNGYCRGSEAYNYVKRVFFLYQNYQNFDIPDD